MPVRVPGDGSALRRVRWIPVLVASLLALGAGTAIGFALGAGDPRAGSARRAGADDAARGAQERTLALTRIIVKPGAELALHHHPGTQIAYVDAASSPTRSNEGSAGSRRARPTTTRMARPQARPGDTARIKPGQWLVEQPSSHHHAANKGDERIVIYLATLFPKGAPPSIPG